MAVRVELNIRFFYEDTLYAETQGFIPRHEAIKISDLRVQENQMKAAIAQKNQVPANHTPKRFSKGKKQYDMEQEKIDENQDIDNEPQDIENDMDIEGEGEEIEQQEVEIQNEDNQEEENEIEEDEIEDEDQENQLSDISQSISENIIYGKYKTKRQKGQLDNFLELPLKKTKKDAKKQDGAAELIRKQEKQRKRRQYLKKLNEAQEKATFDKILNETGRKFRQREEKQMKDENQKEKKAYRALGDIPKIITKETSKGSLIQLHNSELFPAHVHYEPNIRMSENCSICNQAIGKYKTKQGQKFCSIKCYKAIESKNTSQAASA